MDQGVMNDMIREALGAGACFGLFCLTVLIGVIVRFVMPTDTEIK